jgi:hypothetical protein
MRLLALLALLVLLAPLPVAAQQAAGGTPAPAKAAPKPASREPSKPAKKNK